MPQNYPRLPTDIHQPVTLSTAILLPSQHRQAQGSVSQDCRPQQWRRPLSDPEQGNYQSTNT